jgi:hypothetical protein
MCIFFVGETMLSRCFLQIFLQINSTGSGEIVHPDAHFFSTLISACAMGQAFGNHDSVRLMSHTVVDAVKHILQNFADCDIHFVYIYIIRGVYIYIVSIPI